MLNAFVVLFAAVFMPLGMYSAIKSIADNYASGDQYGRPFGLVHLPCFFFCRIPFAHEPNRLLADVETKTYR